MPEQMTKKGNALTARPEGAVTTWSPWNEMTDLRRRMDDLFSQAFGYTPLSRLIPAEMAAEEPEVDIHETDTAFQVLASLPGYTPEQIDVQATDNMLTIQGERKPLFDNEKGKTHRSTGVLAPVSSDLPTRCRRRSTPTRSKRPSPTACFSWNCPKPNRRAPRVSRSRSIPAGNQANNRDAQQGRRGTAGTLFLACPDASAGASRCLMLTVDKPAAPQPDTGSRMSKPELKFLSGPQPRRFELRLALHIFFEFIRGFRQIHFVGPCVTVFGSARFTEGHPYYTLTRKVGTLLAQAGLR